MGGEGPGGGDGNRLAKCPRKKLWDLSGWGIPKPPSRPCYLHPVWKTVVDLITVASQLCKIVTFGFLSSNSVEEEAEHHRQSGDLGSGRQPSTYGLWVPCLGP